VQLICDTFWFYLSLLLDKDTHLKEDEQLARAIQESWNVETSPNENGSGKGGTTYYRPQENGHANGGNTYQPFPFMLSSGFRSFHFGYFA
jgi:hypothetical protein